MAKWWLVSWTTYGTWLPGDERGFRTWRGKQYVPPPKRYAARGEPTYQASEYSVLHQKAQAISEEPVYFARRQMSIALDAMVEEIAQIDVVPAIMSVGAWHVHWLCHFGTLEIRSIVGRVKAAATRALNVHRFRGKRPWAKGCNPKSKSTRRECRNAYQYVLDHVHQGCLIYKWNIDPHYIVFE